VFGCDNGLDAARLECDDTRSISLLCGGMLPPTLVEYALKHGADGVMVTGCRDNDCYYRFGNRWTRHRFRGERKPILRARADRRRIHIKGGAQTDKNKIERELAMFREKLVTLQAENEPEKAAAS
jgi:coenzyme F420-reducing hydrogenase delta subunit